MVSTVVIFKKIDRYVRTPNINVNGISICNERLNWMDLPIIDPINKDHFLSYDKTRLYIHYKKPSVCKIMSNLPSVE